MDMKWSNIMVQQMDNKAGAWDFRSFRFSISQIVVNQGKEVILHFVGVYSKSPLYRKNLLFLLIVGNKIFLITRYRYESVFLLKIAKTATASSL